MPKTYDVDCYFPVHQGCKMTLYQVGTTILPRIPNIYECLVSQLDVPADFSLNLLYHLGSLHLNFCYNN